MKILLAVDDDPSRYEKLSQVLREYKIVLACVQNPIAAKILLDSGSVIGAFLDHDMPYWDGQHYAREVFGPRSFPVCVTSGNPVGADSISEILTDFGVWHQIIPASRSDATALWKDWVLGIYRDDNAPSEILKKIVREGTLRYGSEPLLEERSGWNDLLWNLPHERMEIRVRDDGKINWYRTSSDRSTGNEGWSRYVPGSRFGDPWKES